MALHVSELLAALSLATDLGTGHPLERALRTCLIAVQLGKAARMDDAILKDAYHVALLRFVGCTADMQALSVTFGDEQAAQARVHRIELVPEQMIIEIVRHAGFGETIPRRVRHLAHGLIYGIVEAREAAVAHCEIAQHVATAIGLDHDSLREALSQIYERWDRRGIPGLVYGEALSPAIRLVHLAQDSELYYRIGGREAVVEIVRKRAGGAYDPQLAEILCDQIDRIFEIFNQDSVWDTAIASEPREPLLLNDTQLDEGIQAIADFTDLRSSYTYGHSRAVAELACAAANLLGFSKKEMVRLRYAALIHDVGRVAISLKIWDKNTALTSAEWERVRLYPYYTERIFSRCPQLAEIGSLASLHRERLDGSGYHRGLDSRVLSPLSCLLATADVFQSKIEERAYRRALTPEQAIDELRQQVRAGKLDSAAARAVIDAASGAELARRRENPAGLSDREVEVLQLIAQGLSTRKIAEKLTISPKTADHHIQHIYDKIGISTRAAATLFAIQHNLIGL